VACLHVFPSDPDALFLVKKIFFMFVRPNPIFLHSAYPLGLESSRRYPLGLASGEDACETSYVGFRFG